jgi:hypothetical protein
LLQSWNSSQRHPPLGEAEVLATVESIPSWRSSAGSEAMDDPLARLAVLNGGGVQRSHPNSLAGGSDVEIAARVNQDLSREYGQVVHAEGQFWRYIGTDWE